MTHGCKDLGVLQLSLFFVSLFSPPVRWGLLDFMLVFSSSSSSSSLLFSSSPPPAQLQRAATSSVPCQTSTATIWLSVPCRASTATIWGQHSLPDLNLEIECQKICQKECQKECQKDCQKECHGIHWPDKSYASWVVLLQNPFPLESFCQHDSGQFPPRKSFLVY